MKQASLRSVLALSLLLVLADVGGPSAQGSGAINVIDYGADPKGSASSSLAIANAIDFVCRAGGGTVFFPPGLYRLTETITLGDGGQSGQSQCQNVRLTAVTALPMPWETGKTPGTVSLKWAGPDGGDMVQVNGPIVMGMSGLNFDASSAASRGLVLRHVYSSELDNIVVSGWRDQAIVITAYPKPINGISIGACDNRFSRIKTVAPAGPKASGILIGNAVADGMLDVCRNSISDSVFFAQNSSESAAIIMRYADLIDFYNVYADCNGYECAGVHVQPPLGAEVFPSSISFYNSAINNMIKVEANWRPQGYGGISFWPWRTPEKPIGYVPYFPGGGINGMTDQGHVLGGYQIKTLNAPGQEAVTTAIIDRSQTPTIIRDTGATSRLYQYKLPAGVLGARNNLRFSIFGYYQNTSDAFAALNLDLEFGGAPIWRSGAVSMPHHGFRSFACDFELAGYVDSASRQVARGRCEFGALGSINGTASQPMLTLSGVNDAVAVDSNAANTLVLNVSHNRADPRIAICMQSAILEIR